MIPITHEYQIYWVRTSTDGKVTGALVENAFSEDELKEELADMRRFGEVRRVLASRIVIGEALKAASQQPQ